jgi:hypothetical protein
MASPNFSEFTFAYAIVRQIEEVLGGQIVVPKFPTQREEAKGGYDVEFDRRFFEDGVPLFIQFKRSDVMWYRSCLEYKAMKNEFKPPIFRMHLHRKDRFKQHRSMRALQRNG